jgi:hypothetical protein
MMIMSSQSQIDANRANAQNSRGPVSSEGKARVALNAIKHGLARLNMFLAGEEPEEFLELRNALVKRYRCTDADDALWLTKAPAWENPSHYRIPDHAHRLAFADQPVPALSLASSATNTKSHAHFTVTRPRHAAPCTVPSISCALRKQEESSSATSAEQKRI